MTSDAKKAPAADTAGSVAVQLTGITKRFPGVVANSDINITVRRGTVHALVGENGAGKSTLMKTLYGMHQPEEGTITVNGSQVVFHSPADAIGVGIGMVHQHFMLADNLTVWENIVLGAEQMGSGGRLDVKGSRARIDELGRRYGLMVDSGAMVETLGVGARQRVEILKVLYRGAKILILDEPTAVLVPQEVDELFGNLRELKSEGLTIIFISHKLDEVRSIADDITVIRRGTTVGTADPKTVTNRQLAELMVGSALPVPELRESTVTDRVVLRLAGVRVAGSAVGGRDVLSDIDLAIHAGEVLGIAGVEGNGQAELVDTIMGIRPLAGGSIELAGKDLGRASTASRREAGVGFIPEDRHRQGLILEGSLWENRILGHQTRRPSAAWIPAGPGGREGRHPADRRGIRRPDARHRGHRRVAVRRESAETDRGPRDEREPGAADRLASHSRRGRRRTIGDLGPVTHRAGGRPGRPADLRRPGGVDRHVRPADGHPSGPADRHLRPADRHHPATRRGHDRRR